MYRIVILSLATLLFGGGSLFCQEKKLWCGIEAGAGLGFSDKGDRYDLSFPKRSDMTLNSIRAVLGYHVTPKLSLGAGIGLTRYNNVGINTLPVCLDVRCYPVESNKKWVIISDVGYSILKQGDVTKGKAMAELAFGYQVNIGKNLKLTPSFGYNFSNYSVGTNNERGGQNRHSLFLRFSLTHPL